MNKKWLIQELNALITDERESLWEDYEEGNLTYYENKEGFDQGWELGFVDAVSTMLRILEER
jgi:hypothetical protein